MSKPVLKNYVHSYNTCNRKRLDIPFQRLLNHKIAIMLKQLPVHTLEDRIRYSSFWLIPIPLLSHR